MNSSNKRFSIRAMSFAGLFFLFSATANAELTLEVTASTATDLDFTVTGDFSGYTPPASLSNFLYLVPMDSQGNPVTTWVPSEQTGSHPAGAIDGNTITGWVFVDSDVRSDNYSFLTGDGFNVSFGGGPFDSTAVMTSPYTRSQTGLTLNPADIAYFNLYWGRTVLLATTGTGGTARFNVTKTFSNGADDDVEVTLSCNAGLPLEQSFTIAGGDPTGVTFTVTNLPDGGADCAVSESSENAAYTTVMTGGDGGDDCVWANIIGGNLSCVIENVALPTTVEVNTNFEDIADDGTASDVDTAFETVIICEGVSVDNDDTFEGVEVTDTSGAFTADWYIDPVDGADCEVVLYPDSDAVEGDSCEFSIALGDETAGCDVVGTVFFEGVPVMNRYGLALMVLLMLGVGFVTMRRFA